VEALKNNFVFSNMPETDVGHLVEYLEPFKLSSRTDVVTQGDPADYFYIIMEGEFTVHVGAAQVGSLTKGQSFGETGLLYDSLRNATVRADGEAAVWRLDRATFRQQLARMHVDESKSLSHSLKSARLLKGFSDEAVEKLADVAVQVDYKAGQVIMKKGDKGNLGYFIIEGSVLVTDIGDGIPDLTFGPGEHFGLLAEKSRFATVVADTDVSVSAVSTEDITELLGDISELVKFDHELRKLKSIPLFSEFSLEMLSSLLSAMTTKTFKEGEHVIHQGEVGTTFYLIQTGICEVVQVDDEGNRTVVKTFTDLGYFGEMALLSDSPRNADVVAVTECKIMEVKQATFKRIFGSSSQFSRQMMEVVKGRDKALRLIKNPPEKITRDQLKIIRLLGSGTFGTVHLVEDMKNGLHYAVKEMSVEFIERHKQEANIVGEKKAMFECDHPFILKLYSSFRDPYNIVLLLEFCSGGEMFNIIHNKENNCIPESHVRNLIVIAFCFPPLRTISP
jgi:cGMP-dependent protein kinase